MLTSLKQGLLAIMPGGIRRPLKSVYDVPQRFVSIDDRLQRLMRMHYTSLAAPLSGKSALATSEMKVYSQNGEDGILLYLFAKLGVTNRSFVEFGFGDGKECNTANLAINYGWNGLLMDGGKDKVRSARRYYDDKLHPAPSRVRIAQAFVTAENIESLLAQNGVANEIDLLSIDIDGNDYWVWKAIDIVRSRVVVIEYNATLGTEQSVTVPYDPEFDRLAKHPSGLYHGASLRALTKLAESKGYRLVGCDSCGVNAFYVRDDVAEGIVDAVPVEDAYYPMARRIKYAPVAEQFDRIKNLDFETV